MKKQKIDTKIKIIKKSLKTEFYKKLIKNEKNRKYIQKLKLS